jgi:hypothetical protein
MLHVGTVALQSTTSTKSPMSVATYPATATFDFRTIPHGLTIVPYKGTPTPRPPKELWRDVINHPKSRLQLYGYMAYSHTEYPHKEITNNLPHVVFGYFLYQESR